MATNRATVVGVFQDRQHAQQAVEELRRMGFKDDQIGVATRDDNRTPEEGSKETHAEEGAKWGLATGAGVGALWGLGALAGLLPVIGPVIAGGSIAAILASGALGAAAVGLGGALIGLGIPEDEAKYYEGELQSGRTVVTVQAGSRDAEAVAVLRRLGGYDMSNRAEQPSSASASKSKSMPQAVPVGASARTEGGETLQAREEELHVRKTPVETGEVKVRKEVHTEHRTLEVPVTKEEIVIERRAVGGHQVSGSDMGEAEEIRIPVREEQIHVEKQAVVKEEVRVGKRKTQNTETVSGTVRKEEIKVEKDGDIDVREKRS